MNDAEHQGEKTDWL